MKTVEERLDILERQVRKHAGRTTRTVRGLIPWLPISGHVERPSVDGECFAFMFPLSGTIQRVMIAVEEFPEGKPEAIFEVSITKADRVIADRIQVRQKEASANVTYEVKEGMRVRVLTKDDVKGVWVSFLLEPDKQYYTPIQEAADADRTGEKA